MPPSIYPFLLTPLKPFTQPGAAIKRPTELTYFSYDATRAFHANSILSLRYYYTPPLGVSLSEGFETFIKMDEEGDEHLDGLLRAIEGVEKEKRERVVGYANGTEGEVDVVTWRGMMTKVMVAPYSQFDSFEMNATLFQVFHSPHSGEVAEMSSGPSSVIFFQNTLRHIHTARAIRGELTSYSFIEEDHEYKLSSRKIQETQQTRPGNQTQELMSYWGYKFETLCLLPDTWDATSREYIENRQKHVVSNAAQFCSVVQTSIGGTKLVIGGEIDAVWDAKSVDQTTRTNWVELKTSAEFRFPPTSAKHPPKSYPPKSNPPKSNPHKFPHDHGFERKLLKFWAQSFLLGVPKIIVGFRSNDEKGTLLRVEEFETTGIPKLVREQGHKSWDKDVCVNCAGAWLDFLKKTITTPGVWKIKRRSRSPAIEIWKQEESGHGDILSADFVAWRTELARLEAKTAVDDVELDGGGGGIVGNMDGVKVEESERANIMEIMEMDG